MPEEFKERHKDIVAEKVIMRQDEGRTVQEEIYGRDHDGNKVWILITISSNTQFGIKEIDPVD